MVALKMPIFCFLFPTKYFLSVHSR